MSDSRTKHLDRIRSAAFAVELRLRVARALRALPTALTLALAIAAGTLAVHKALPAHLSEPRARQILLGAGLLVLATVALAMLRRLPPRAGTIALDRHHGLHDRLTNALAFDALPAAQRTALMEAAIDDACEHANELRPAGAAPLALPRELWASAAVGLGVLAVALLEVRTPRKQAPVAQTIDALTMSPDDIELFKDAAKALDRQDQSPEMKSAVERFNQLIEDIANKRLDRTEAFRRMEALERELLKGAEADLKALEEALKETGLDLKRSDLAKGVGESLEKKDLEQAKKELKQLAEKLRDKKQKLDKAEIERLRKALADAASRRKEALAAINEKRAEVREQLLKQKQKASANERQKSEEERLLKKKERELERLDRDAEQKERTGRQLDRLDRELAKAAEDLMRDLGMSADDLEQAAEDINRMQQEEMSEQEKEELRQRLEELRELVRQQGQGGKQRMARMLRFGKRARGNQGSGEQQQGQGQQGQGDGEQEGQEGQQGQGGQGKGGQGQGQELVIGPGGKKILMPGGQGQGQEGQGSGQGNQGGGNQPGGDGAGSGRGGEIAGKRTDPKLGTQDVQAQGLDTQQGPSNSEVILSAAERGFKGTGYKKVFTDYHTVAEQQINKDQIPDGYRFYVNRYFQLIRPRE
ncbi:MULTISPECIES: hypothetical protein [Sorangium]|uniref:Exported glycine/glutamine-rich protein n=1 Tax=Sorangium cellulosum TaxID=56 RepID=A0A4V0NH35_SORCE|nr:MULTISPECIES: hypothetical protein [Sorangium]AUX35292.1 exported glycine/glutamine-rich protein [Sorangium cellulosum]WCQ94596.1 hypothetical protein NQZ70_07364 [Sorangium sp. Soce836]